MLFELIQRIRVSQMGFLSVYQACTLRDLSISTQKTLAKELGRDNIRLSKKVWGILTTYKFDMENIG